MPNSSQRHIKNKEAAIGYCRVSTDDQADNGLSLDYQEEQCRSAAQRDGYSGITIIRDEGKSGKNLRRKGIQEVIDLAKKKEISIVYVTHSDRLARNIVDHSFLRLTFTSNGVSLKYLNGQSSGDDASSIMADNMFATINQYHSDNTREKTRQATDAKAYAGYFPTHAPVGYINCSNPNKACEKVAKKIIMPHPTTAALVTEAFKLYATGQYNVYQLNDMMHEKGLRTVKDKKLVPSMFYNMLKNRIYLGEIHWMNIHVKDGKHIPLIDEATFDRAQKMLFDKGGNRCRRRKYFWLLNGYVFCPIHKRRYTAEWHLKKLIAYYHCSNKSGCGKYVEKSVLERQVSEKFKNLQLSSSFVQSVITKVKSIFEARRDEYHSKQRILLNQKNAWLAKLQTAEDRLLDGTLSNSDYTRVKADSKRTLGGIEDKISTLVKTNEISVDVVSEILSFTKNIYSIYMKSPEPLQKRFIDLFFDGFEVVDGVIIKDRYSPIFEELMRLEAVTYKTAKSTKALKIKADSRVILSPKLGAVVEDVRTVFERINDATIYIPRDIFIPDLETLV